GCVFVLRTKESRDWDTLTAERTIQALQQESWLKGVVEVYEKDFPATYLFKTARGEYGIVQILGFTDEKPRAGGVKLRYKLVQGSAAKATGAPSPTASGHSAATFAIPFLTAEQRIAVIKEAHKAFTDFVHSDGKEQDGENIPKKFW